MRLKRVPPWLDEHIARHCLPPEWAGAALQAIDRCSKGFGVADVRYPASKTDLGGGVVLRRPGGVVRADGLVEIMHLEEFVEQRNT